LVMQIQENEPSETFATTYLAQANVFFKKVVAIREEQLKADGQDKVVVDKYYNA